MRITLSRVVEFRAMHRLYHPGSTEAENRARFGWTAAPPGHTHRYRCTVSVSGPVDATDAIVMDLGELDRILADEIVGRFDGRHLNTDIPELAGVLPTCEAIARDIFVRVARRLPSRVELRRVRLAEDASLYADCTGAP